MLISVNEKIRTTSQFYDDLKELSEQYQEIIDLNLPFNLMANNVFLKKLLFTFPFLQTIELNNDLFKNKLVSFIALEADDFLNFEGLDEDQFFKIYKQFQELTEQEKVLVLFLALHAQDLNAQNKPTIVSCSKIDLDNSHLKLLNILANSNFKSAMLNSTNNNHLDDKVVSMSHGFDDSNRQILFFYLLIEFNSNKSLDPNKFDLLFFGVNPFR